MWQICFSLKICFSTFWLLKLILKSPRFVSIGTNLTQFGWQVLNPCWTTTLQINSSADSHCSLGARVARNWARLAPDRTNLGLASHNVPKLIWKSPKLFVPFRTKSGQLEHPCTSFSVRLLCKLHTVSQNQHTKNVRFAPNVGKIGTRYAKDEPTYL